MRIRKNAKLSPLLFSSSSSSLQGGSSGSTLQTHVCQLNQSPWDVIPFDSDSIQLDLDDNFTAGNNGSAGDSFGAVESAASMMDADEKVRVNDMMMIVVDDNHDNNRLVGNNNSKGVVRNSCCQGQCKNEVKQGQSFCVHHLSLLRSNNNNSNANSNGRSGHSNKKAAAVAVTAVTGNRIKPRAKKAPSSNPNEFYYYSGFGPLWGKRRGDKNGEGSKNSVQRGENSKMAESDNALVVVPVDNNNIQNVVTEPLEVDNEEFDYVDDDDDEEEDMGEDDGGKKRMRKPVKARSLKSLM